MVNETPLTVLVTGGAGYIGSHTVLEMAALGMTAVVVDNLDNSSEESLRRVAEITGRPDLIKFRKVDLLDEPALEAVFNEFKFDACVHFAGLKAVGESVHMPIRYYHNNLTGTCILLNLLMKYNCKNFVFSSSATVYGLVKEMPVTETVEIGATNPYGRTKLFIEEFLRDLYKSDPEWNVLILRYFNPVGAHKSGRIGEDPQGHPNNLMPFLSQVAVGRREFLTIFGDDYPTPDGTGVRDYIHVVDLAKGHIAALRKLAAKPGCVPVNLGTGRAYSVKEMLAGMSKACGHELKYEVAARREGDIAELYADPAFAKKFLGWEASLGLDEMCADTWRWQSRNPKGFKEPEQSRSEAASGQI
jgi:UDP-glucose 4-epimerase